MWGEEEVRREMKFWIDRAYEYSREGRGMEAWCAGYLVGALSEMLGEGGGR